MADPKDYDKVRDRVRADMARSRELDPSDKNEGKSLSEGYRLLGDKLFEHEGGGVLRAEGIGFSAGEWPEKILGRLEGN